LWLKQTLNLESNFDLIVVSIGPQLLSEKLLIWLVLWEAMFGENGFNEDFKQLAKNTFWDKFVLKLFIKEIAIIRTINNNNNIIIITIN